MQLFTIKKGILILNFFANYVLACGDIDQGKKDFDRPNYVSKVRSERFKRDASLLDRKYCGNDNTLDQPKTR